MEINAAVDPTWLTRKLKKHADITGLDTEEPKTKAYTIQMVTVQMAFPFFTSIYVAPSVQKGQKKPHPNTEYMKRKTKHLKGRKGKTQGFNP